MLETTTQQTIHRFPLITQRYFSQRYNKYVNYDPRYYAYTLSREELEDAFRDIGGRLEDMLIININSIKNKREAIDQAIKSYWLSLADKVVTNVITPWTLEATLNDDGLLHFFDEGSNTIDIIVKIGDKEYDHDLTEELALGLLILLKNTWGVYLYLKDVDDIPLSLEDIVGNYLNVTNKKYTANTQYGSIGFDTIDVIQGVITGSSWLNQDSHNFIKDIRRDDIPVTF